METIILFFLLGFPIVLLVISFILEMKFRKKYGFFPYQFKKGGNDE